MDSALYLSQLDVKEFLRPILLGLAEEDLDELARAAVMRIFPAGTVICQEGEAGDAIYVIVQGRVDILKQLDDESQRYLHRRDLW